MLDPSTILQPSGVRCEDCNLPPSQGERLNERVAARLEALLARVDGVRRGSDIDRPVTFNADGEQHAQSIAARDASEHASEAHSTLPGRQLNMRQVYHNSPGRKTTSSK